MLTASPATEPVLRECFGCGLFQIVPALGEGMRADCGRCGTPLRRTHRDSLDRCLALVVAGFVLFVVLWLGMLMKVSTAGIEHESTLFSGPAELIRSGLWPLAVAVFLTTAVAPLAKFGGTAYVLLGLRARRPWPGLGGVFRIVRKASLWSMLEVLLLGVFVAFTKLGDLVTIGLGPAVYALALLTIITVWADSILDRDLVWSEIQRRGQTYRPIAPGASGAASLVALPGAVGCEECGLVSVPGDHDGHCPRCGATLHARKPNSLGRTWALIIASAILYIPANYYPVLTVIQLGNGQPSTILGGVEELISSRLYPLAILVFFASILVPVLKLAGLAIMLMATVLITTEAGTARWLRERTTLYHVVAWIGRWSMVDIFMESLLGALVQFGTVVSIAPGVGAVAFCGVVFLTIIAAETFDPRVMWDAGLRRTGKSVRVA